MSFRVSVDSTLHLSCIGILGIGQNFLLMDSFELQRNWINAFIHA